MKSIFLVVICLIISISLLSQTIEINQYDLFPEQDSTETRTQTLGQHVPSIGIFKILVIESFELESRQKL